MRHGYRLKDMVEQFDAKAAEIRAMFNSKLEPARSAELRACMQAASPPRSDHCWSVARCQPSGQ